jgi:Domain of unknown function (DUF4115)
VPEERWEWVAFFLGIAVTVALLALIVFDHRSTTHDTRPAAATLPRTTTSAPPTTTTRTAPTTTATTTPPQQQPPVRLRLTARADTWLSVRRTSGTGGLLYQGTLAKGATRTFSGSSFEVRFGAAANVAATLNGRPLSLPGGTYSVTVGKSGLGPRAA